MWLLSFAGLLKRQADYSQAVLAHANPLRSLATLSCTQYIQDPARAMSCLYCAAIRGNWKKTGRAHTSSRRPLCQCSGTKISQQHEPCAGNVGDQPQGVTACTSDKLKRQSNQVDSKLQGFSIPGFLSHTFATSSNRCCHCCTAVTAM